MKIFRSKRTTTEIKKERITRKNPNCKKGKLYTKLNNELNKLMI